MLKKAIPLVLLASIITGFIVLYAQLIEPAVLGFIHDDGIYAVLAKSLAEGHGYRLLHLIGEPYEVKYPFFYPAVLSVVWRFFPQFPENLVALSWVSIVCSALSMVVFVYYCRSIKKLPWILTLGILICAFSNFYALFFYTVTMSEALYLLLSLATIVLAEKLITLDHSPASAENTVQVSKPLSWQKHWLPWLGLIVLSDLCCLTRLLGVAVVGSIVLCLLFLKRFKAAVAYGGVVFFTSILPWLLWVKAHTASVTDLNLPITKPYANYGAEFFNQMATGKYWVSIQNALFMLIEKLTETTMPLLNNMPKTLAWLNLDLSHPGVNIAESVLSHLFFGYLILLGVQALNRFIRQSQSYKPALSISGVYVILYCVLIVMWNYADQMARFLIVIAPLVWVIAVQPLSLIMSRKPVVTIHFQKKTFWKNNLKLKQWVAAAVLVAMFFSGVWLNTGGERRLRQSRLEHWVEDGKYPWLWQEYKQTFAWINQNLPKASRLAVSSDVLFYLYTQHPTLYVFFASLKYTNDKPAPNAIPLLLKSFEHYGIAYLVVEPHLQMRTVMAKENLIMHLLRHEFPERFKKIYQSPRGAIKIYKLV
ncbi:MAG: hypothetical protein AAGI66_06750 [Cyanobacteria bacterium P01_H01_bin.74]